MGRRFAGGCAMRRMQTTGTRWPTWDEFHRCPRGPACACSGAGATVVELTLRSSTVGARLHSTA
eukprot:6921424-Prymnesium_polylepis.1